MHRLLQVTYDADGFCEANRDTLYKDLVILMQTTNRSAAVRRAGFWPRRHAC